MNKQMKQHLEAVVSALVEQDTSAAKAAFHEYLRLKSQSVLIGEEADEDKEDKKSDDKDKDEDESDDKEDKKSKKDDKSDDKEDKKAKPFEKKSDDKDD